MYTFGVITVSDKGARGEREDKSGELIKTMMHTSGYQFKGYVIVPDEVDRIKRALIDMCDQGINIILTTGGTGFSKRDVTPEATKLVIEREALGLVFAMLSKGLEVTPKAMLSRATAGIRGESLIINLPGSPKAVAENLEVVLPVLGHGLGILCGTDGECG